MGAGRIRSQNMSAGRICPRPASAADLAKFADTAFSLITVRFPEIAENLRLQVKFPKVEISLSEISALDIQKSAGLHYSPVGYENESAAGQTSALGFCFAVNALRNSRKMRCACCFNPDFSSGTLFGNPEQGFFIFRRWKHLGIQFPAAAGWDEEKEIHRRSSDVFSKIQNLCKLVDIESANGSIYLKLYVRFPGTTYPGKAFFKCAGAAPESVVCGSICTVQAYAQGLDS